MAFVVITRELKQEILRRFRGEAVRVFRAMRSLEKQPRKGKALCSVSGVVIKELRYGKFRFYFLTDGHVLKFGSAEELASQLIKFVRMSEKKDQQRVIREITRVLRSLGFDQL